MASFSPRALVACLVVAALLLPAALVLDRMPLASASPVVIDRFSDGSAGANLTFVSRTWNDSLSVDVPRGATVTRAELTVAGVEGASIGHRVIDFSTDAVGDHLWAVAKGGPDYSPPTVDPYASGWDAITAADVVNIAAEDGLYWHTQDPNLTQAAPWEWPVQLYHFNPQVGPVGSYDLSWNGYGFCSANQSQILYQGELWLYNQTNSTWDQIATYSGNVADDQWLNASFGADSAYVSGNGSVDAAVVGPHSDVMIHGPVPKMDYGHIYTDYIALRVGVAATMEFPWNVTLDAGGRNMNVSAGALSGTVVIGDALGLRQALQRAIDAQDVSPGYVNIGLNFSIGWPTWAQVQVKGLLLEYEPVVNAPPVWRGPASADVQEDSQWTPVLDLGAAFSDDHNQAALRFCLVSSSDPANLSTSMQFGLSGNWTLAVKPATNFFGEVVLVVNATDLFNAVAESPAVTVRVLQVPDRPSLEDPGLLQATEGVPFNYTLKVIDPDLPDDNFTFTDTSPVVDVNATTGRIDWTPTKGEVGAQRFNVVVRDRFGLSSMMTVNIQVANVDDPPRITSPLALEVRQDQAVTYTIVATDPDVPLGDALSYYAFSEDIEVKADMATGKVTFTPTNDNVGTLHILLRAQDKAGLKDDRTLTVTVLNVNDPPTLDDIGDQARKQGDVVSVHLVLTDPDLAVAGAGEHLALTSDGPAWLAPDAAGWINFTADQSRVGTWWANYTVTDATGLTDTIHVQWTIADVNDPPVITTEVPGTVDAKEDTPFTLALSATDLDGDALTWSDDSPLFVIGRSNGTVSFTPLQKDVGTHRVTVTVSDGRGGTASRSFDLAVANVNDAPAIKAVAPVDGTTYKEGEPVSFMATATDEDGDALTYVWKEGKKELGRGSTFTTSKLGAGKHTVTLAVSDGNATTESTVDLVVTAKAGAMPSAAIIGAVVVLVVVVLVVVAALAMRARRGAPPAASEAEVAYTPEPAEAAEPPTGGTPEGEAGETPKIEIEFREV